MIKKVLLSSAMLLGAVSAQAAEDHSHHHSSHKNYGDAPASIMGAHVHGEGEMMLSYNLMKMNMHGAIHSDSKVDSADIYSAGYAVAPLEMETTMHMFGAMYGVTSQVTAMVMLPYVEKQMKLKTSGGTEFTTKSRGWGDTKVSAIYEPKNPKFENFLFGLGVSLPTGATDRRHATPMGAETKLAYPMQIGSGSYELLPSITYQCDCRDGIYYGAQAKANIRLTDAQEGYTLGDELHVSSWVGKQWNSKLSNTLSVTWDKFTNGEGFDTDINPAMMPGNDMDMQAKDRISLGLGAAYKPNWVGEGKFLVEAKLPVYERADGYSLKAEKSLMLTFRKAF